jgi:hypothetical protein
MDTANMGRVERKYLERAPFGTQRIVYTAAMAG